MINKLIHNLSIKYKLTAMMMFVTTILLSLVFLLAMISEIRSFRTTLEEKTKLNVAVIKNSCIAALDFNRVDAAEEALRTLKSSEEIIYGGIFVGEDSLFANYRSELIKEKFVYPLNYDSEGIFWGDNHLFLSENLSISDRVLGKIFVVASLSEMKKNILIVFFNMIFIGSLLLIISYFLALYLQKYISEPITKLADFTKHISTAGNFGESIEATSNDEIGILYKEFNALLAKVNISSSERDKALYKLNIRKERLKYALEGANDGLWDWELKTDFFFLSPRSKLICGITDEEFNENREDWKKNIHPEDAPLVESKLLSHLSDEKSNYECEYRIKKHDGNYCWILDRGKIVERDKVGKPQRMVGTHSDINDRKQFEKELQDAKDTAEKSNKMKTEFLAQMSHEIRSPINIILNFTGLMRDEINGKIDEELFSCFDSIDRAGQRIIRTIDLLLNMSEIQTGAFEPNREKIDLVEDIIKSLYLEYAMIAQAKKLDLILKLKIPKAKKTIDKYSVNQIFANLIDNAIKYTNAGSIEIIVYKNTNDNIAIDIKDTGIGISEEFQTNIFQPFSQEYQGYTRPYEGNGLGLALVQKYCQLNNAEITFISNKDEGTTFTVTFLDL